MSDGLNRVQLLGNLCADPELRATSGGSAVLNMRLATNESYLDKNRERKERVEYHSVVLWGKRAEPLARLLSKGSRIFVEGSLRTTSYEARDGGGKRYKTEVNATNVILCGGRGEQRGAAASDEAPVDDGGFGGETGDDDAWPF